VRRPTLSLLIAALGVLLAVPLGAAPPEAGKVVAEASAKAAASGKSVMVFFHASWCGWCRRLAAYPAARAIKPILDKYFEMVWLDVQERGAAKAQENPGGAKLMVNLGGATSGLPFFAVLDARGKTLATSLNPTNARNIGCPESLAEIGHFQNMVRAGAPKVTDAELTTLRQGLERRILP
jgi:hypothetical protein